MDIKDIKEGKTFYRLRITSAGQIYELNKVTVDAIRGNLQVIFQIKYIIPNSDFISYPHRYNRLYVEESSSPYFIKMGGEEYLTLPNKQALMKAVRTQMMRYARLYTKPLYNYKQSMKIIKSLY